MIIEKIQVHGKTFGGSVSFREYALVQANGNLVIKVAYRENGMLHIRNSGSDKYIRAVWRKLKTLDNSCR